MVFVYFQRFLYELNVYDSIENGLATLEQLHRVDFSDY